jgi:FecR protein
MHTLLSTAALVVSFVPLHAQCPLPTDSRATVLVMSGSVSAMSDTSGYATPLFACGFVKAQQVIKTGADGYAKFQVSDGSTFEVFGNSEVTFRKTYSFGDLLNVWLGKVKVYIQHLPGIPNPNNVTTPTALISVRGTIFDVDVEDLEGTTFVSLDEGQVVVKHLRVASPLVILKPGESVRVIPNLPLAAIGIDKGGLARRILQAFQDAARQVAYTRPGGTTAPGGTPGTTGGAQGDKGKNTGTTSGTGTGAPTGSPTGTSTGAPPAPPPPPPGGGGD